MIKLPARPDGGWTVTHRNDKLPDVISTRNITFDKDGYLRLSKPTASFFSEVDDADFGVPMVIQEDSEGLYYVLTTENQFILDMQTNYGAINVTEDVETNTPDNTGSYYPDAAYFDQKIVYANPTDRKLYTTPGYGNTWTVNDTSASLEVSSDLFLNTFVPAAQIMVGNDNQVDVFSTAYAAGTQLQLPNEYTITGLVYNNGYVGITTRNKSNTGRCMFFAWDGATAAANYAVEVPATASYAPTPYKGSFVFIDANGVLWYWTPSGLELLDNLPLYISGGYIGAGKALGPKNHSIFTDGELIHISVKSVLYNINNNGTTYTQDNPSGIWTYDPAVGFYHRHSLTGTKIITNTIATTSVNTTDNTITVTAAPETGTPVRYTKSSGTLLAGLVSERVYYTIKVDATTVKLATTYANALANTPIDLTGTGNNAQTLQFYPKTDFGQSYAYSHSALAPAGGKSGIPLYFQDFFYGTTITHDTAGTRYNTGGFVLQDTENRGNFVTNKFTSSGLQEEWQKLYIKHSVLTKDTDAIVVKYRTDNDTQLIKTTTGATEGLITWTDSNTFTSTDTQFANVQVGDEIDFIEGTGAGYLAHVTSITENSGTYTVNIDESIKNLTASKTGRVTASRWLKAATFTSSTETNADGYSMVHLATRSKQIQFKIELRGEDVEIEEMLLDNKFVV